MTSILIFIIILLVVAGGALAVFAWQEAKRHGTNTKALLRVKLRTGAEELVGICKSTVETASQKQARKQKIMALFEGGREFSNFEIRKALGVSSRTAVRYLDELEKEGKVEQVGKIGHAVTYRLR